ncbi:MFS transporter [Roseateles sp. DAIF2]|uniref:MFS transporter n=1 Tax=Roseateles sp. DAIF2 TaxID=2714952 RepID=UPI0018A2E29B|nr:MFS transporter [Roseateles sp. DAIF2]QPF72367.1 MFS transporter [Roseateles sp. DAIF2]
MNTHALPDSTAQAPRRASFTGGLLAGYGLLVLVIATIFSALDRQIFVLLAEPLGLSLGLSDTKLGLLQGAGITLFSGLAAVPLGWLADRWGRRLVLAACVLVWAVATAACGLARDFDALFIAAIGLGLGEAGLAPIVYGLIPDIVPERRRVLANGIYALAAILGAGLGIALSGALVQALEAVRHVLPAELQPMETWRLAFLAVALPGPLVALAVLLIRLHPQGGAVLLDAGHARAAPALGPFLRAHRRTMLGMFGGSGLAGLGVAASGNWVPVVATRIFGESAAQVGNGVGSAYLLGTGAGAAIGMACVKLLGRRVGLALPVRVVVIGSALSVLASLAMLLTQNATGLYLLFGLQVATLIAGSVLAPTMLQDMSPAALRSRVIAIGSALTVGLSALSPVLVGAWSDRLTTHPHGLLIAMAGVGAAAFALAALAMVWAEPHFARTVAAIHPGLAARRD